MPVSPLWERSSTRRNFRFWNSLEKKRVLKLGTRREGRWGKPKGEKYKYKFKYYKNTNTREDRW